MGESEGRASMKALSSPASYAGGGTPGTFGQERLISTASRSGRVNDRAMTRFTAAAFVSGVSPVTEMITSLLEVGFSLARVVIQSQYVSRLCGDRPKQFSEPLRVSVAAGKACGAFEVVEVGLEGS